MAKAKFKVEVVSGDEFWPVFKKYRSKLFKNEMAYSLHDIRTSKEQREFRNLREGLKNRIEVFILAKDLNGKVIGWSTSYQVNIAEMYMMNSAVFLKWRKMGVYKAMAEETLKISKNMGFQVVTSNHLATNNPVIIAKLKLNFCITGLELTDHFGVLVKLTHYLNPVRRKSAFFRAGAIKPDQKLKKLFNL